MVFLPGDHVLDRNITIDNVTRLTMCGESSSDNIATVVRNGSVGFSFTNMVDFNIYSLAFTSYNRSWSYGSHPASNSALLLQSTQNTKLVNCSFHDNIGAALAVKNTSVTLVENTFIHNQCTCGPFSEIYELGCGITTFSSNLTFIGNTSFLNSTQRVFHATVNCAGAIWASASSLHFTGTNSFIGNSANGISGVGGAVYAEANTLLSFSGTSNFSHNSAQVGGAICIVGNVAFTFNGTNMFVNNAASDSGGAIYAGSNTLLSFIGTNEFSHNSAERHGGAIYAMTNISLIFIGTNDFTHNSAGNKGGAICTEYNIVLTLHGTNNFINNSASDSGGAIFTAGNTLLSFSGTNEFSHNSAEHYGGAILAGSNTLLNWYCQFYS